ncbi:MAG: LamG domain-containing protein [Planctomycetes bacterium]|nr:LamG domain-containing protein [Planctomycetota bacterium]
MSNLFQGLALVIALVSGPSRAEAQNGCGTAQSPDCDCDGVPDQSNPVSLVVQDDGGVLDLSSGLTVTRDIVSNDGYTGRVYDGHTDPQGNPDRVDTIRVMPNTFPRHGSAAMVEIPHAPFANDEYHGARCNWSLGSRGKFEMYDRIGYRLRDQCGNESTSTALFYYKVTDANAPNNVLSLAAPAGGPPNWILVPDAYDLDPPAPPVGTNQLMIECWLRPTQLGTPMVVLSKWADFDGVSNLNERSYAIGIEADGAVQFSISDPAHQLDGAFHEFRAGRLQAGVWQHVACSFDGVDRRIFIDGELVGIKNAPCTIHAGLAHLSIGAQMRNLDTTNVIVDAAHAYVGRMDSLRMWKVARPPYRIRSDRWSRHHFAPAPLPSASVEPDIIVTFDFENSHEDGTRQFNAQPQGSMSYFAADYGALQMIDCNANGLPDDCELEVRGPQVDADGNGVIDSCEVHSFCLGDGTAGACPCGNSGALGNGCANSAFATGAHLGATGTPSVALDTVVLSATGMTGTTSFYFQGDAQQASLPIGDGLGCVSGTVVRLATKAVAGNASSFPGVGDPSLSTRGQLPVFGGTRYYQCAYRNTFASFCPPGTSNRTNGVVLIWGL